MLSDEERAKRLVLDIQQQDTNWTCCMNGDKTMTHILAAFAAIREECAKELKSLKAFKRSVEEAINSGDGVYRP